MEFKPPPTTSEAVNKNDRRNRDKLRRSPGSYFIGRARELRLAAPYFLRNLKGTAYGGTASAHYYNLCGATFVAMMSAFEVLWRNLYAGIIDATSRYDDRLLAKSSARDVVHLESLLAHRDEASAGSVVAASLPTWQRASSINESFESLMEMRPISKDEVSVIDRFWQIRHIVAHGAGVVGRLESYRLGGTIAPDDSLQIGPEYLKYAESALGTVVKGGVGRIRDRLLRDYFSHDAQGAWSEDREQFRPIHLLTVVVPKTTELPRVTKKTYEVARSEYET